MKIIITTKQGYKAESTGDVVKYIDGYVRIKVNQQWKWEKEQSPEWFDEIVSIHTKPE